MRRQRGLVRLTGLAALVGLGLTAQPTSAAVTTEQSASILVFPKVIANGTRDTIIQITNTSNNMRHAHCFYVNAAPTVPGVCLDPSTFTGSGTTCGNGLAGCPVTGEVCIPVPPGPNNPPLWTEIDFDIWLTKQQPTHWVVSTGRLDNPLDAECSVSTTCCENGAAGSCPGSTTSSGGDNAACCDAGFDPGHVPPVAPDFEGELKCIEVDSSGMPISGNSLKGEATLENISEIDDANEGDVSKYNAIGLRGNDNNNGDGTLCLGGGVVPGVCDKGAEYDACPASWFLDHPTTGAPDELLDELSVDSTVSTNLTVVPCTENFESQAPTSVVLQFLVTNEFEQTLSASTTVTCWASWDLGATVNGVSDIFNEGTIGGEILQTTMRSAAKTQTGVLAVIEETHHDIDDDLTARAAQNGFTSFQDQPGPDIITIPTDQIQGP